MRHLNYGRARIVQPLEKLHDLFALRGMKITRRLIGKDQFRVLNYGPRHPYQLLLAARELIWEQILLSNDVELVEGITNQAGPFFVRYVFVAERHFQVLVYGKRVDQVVALKYEANAVLVQFVPLLGVESVHWLVVEEIFTGPCAVQHAENAQQRGLACS